MSSSKVKSSKSGGFGVNGGSGHMSGKNTAGPQKPGVSSQQGASSAKFASGGNGHMIGQKTVGAQAPGGSAVDGKGGNNNFSVKGGSGHMVGNRGSQPAKPA